MYNRCPLSLAFHAIGFLVPMLAFSRVAIGLGT